MKPIKTKGTEVLDKLQEIMDSFSELEQKVEKLETEKQIFRSKLQTIHHDITSIENILFNKDIEEYDKIDIQEITNVLHTIHNDVCSIEDSIFAKNNKKQGKLNVNNIFTITFFNGGRNDIPKIYSDMKEALANYKIECALEIARVFKNDSEIQRLSSKIRYVGDVNDVRHRDNREKIADKIIEYTEGTYPYDISYSLHLCKIKNSALIQLFAIR